LTARPAATELTLELPNRRATRGLAKRIAATLTVGDLVILDGALGAGKTFFVRAMARALGLPCAESVTSPTFALVQELGTSPRVVHADLYRLGQSDDILDLGLDAARAEAAVIVEWGKPFIESLGGDALCVHVELSPRRARISATGERSRTVLAELLTTE
jgi:tRNA threonylcarbamoyladenosine biosynthesis protein TsaE